MNVRSVVLVVVVLALGLVYLRACHDPAVRRAALQAQQDQRDDSVHQANEKWKADFAAREVERERVLALTDQQLTTARNTIAQLKRRIIPRDSIADAVLREQIAVRDSLITQQDSVIAQQARVITIWTAMSRDRDTRIAQLELETAALRVSRDGWRQQAQPGLLTRIVRGLPYVAAGALIWEIAR